jgi:5'(3')-deoxyribonucleotidase
MGIFNCDVDNVCADWTGHVLAELELVLGRPSPPRELQMKHDINPILDEEQQELLLTMLSGPTFWASLPIIPGAQEGIEAIRNEGHEVYFVTTPWVSCETWEHERRTWLAMHFGADYKHMVPVHDKHMWQGDVFVDDRPDKVKKYVQRNPYATVFLYEQPYNVRERKDWASFTWDNPEMLMYALKQV